MAKRQFEGIYGFSLRLVTLIANTHSCVLTNEWWCEKDRRNLIKKSERKQRVHTSPL